MLASSLLSRMSAFCCAFQLSTTSSAFAFIYSPEWHAQFRWQNPPARSPKHLIGLGSKKKRLVSSNTRLDSTTSKIDYPTPLIVKGSLSPPKHINQLEIGEQLDAFRRRFVKIETDLNVETQYQELKSDFSIERVSYLPDAFVLRESFLM